MSTDELLSSFTNLSTSDLSSSSPPPFPLEILRQFARHASDDASALSSWCLVSHSMLSFAGPLLYRHVVLRKPEHVMPFLERLRLPRTSSDPALLLPIQSTVEVSVLALPPAEELEALSNRKDLVQDPNLWTGGIRKVNVEWSGQDQVDMVAFWVPRLLLVLNPKQQYNPEGYDVEMLGRHCANGALLRVYLLTIASFPGLPPASSLGTPISPPNEAGLIADPTATDSLFSTYSKICQAFNFQANVSLHDYPAYEAVLGMAREFLSSEEEEFEDQKKDIEIWAIELATGFEWMYERSMLRPNDEWLTFEDLLGHIKEVIEKREELLGLCQKIHQVVVGQPIEEGSPDESEAEEVSGGLQQGEEQQ